MSRHLRQPTGSVNLAFACTQAHHLLRQPTDSGAQEKKTTDNLLRPIVGDLTSQSFFIFIFIFFDFSKIYVLFIFFQKCHPAAGSSGGRLLPPDEPAVGWVRCGPWWAETYRRLNRR